MLGLCKARHDSICYFLLFIEIYRKKMVHVSRQNTVNIHRHNNIINIFSSV